MFRHLLLVIALFLAAEPILAETTPPPRAQLNARIAALCDADMDCMAKARQAIRQHCGQDRACSRMAIERAETRQGKQTASLSDLPPKAQDLVRALLKLAQNRQTSATPEPQLGQAARDQLNALPPRLQNRIRQRCRTDPDCIRRAMIEARSRRDQKQADSQENTTPEEQPEAQPEAQTDASEPGAVSNPKDLFVKRPRAPRELHQQHTDYMSTPQINTDGPNIISPSQHQDFEDEETIVYGTGRTTWVSGSKDDRVRSLMAPEGSWLVGIRMSEVSDDPCDIDTYFAEEGNVSSPRKWDNSLGGAGFSQCGDRDGNKISAHLLAVSIYENERSNFREKKDYPYPVIQHGEKLGTPYAITGLQVCQRERNDLVKGLRIYNAWLDLDDTPVSTEQHMKTITDIPTAAEAAAGQVPKSVQVPNELEFERPNCNAWAEQRMCPDGQVGIGVDVHYNVANSGRAQITGLALHCAQLTR